MILIITNDRYQSIPILSCVQRVGEQFDVALNAAQALHRCIRERYSVVIIDCHQQLSDYLELLQQLQSKTPNCAVLIVARQGCDAERIMSLEMGAQDYIEFPFNPAEMQARVRVQLRRAQSVNQMSQDPQFKPVQIGNFCIDDSYHRVEIDGEPLTLTAKEFSLLHFLASNPDKVYSRNHLLSAVWGQHYGGYEHTINSHINRLRGKLSNTSAGANLVETVWGVGYKFNSQPLELTAPA